MSENSTWEGLPESVMEIYEEELDDLKRELISFRGHGLYQRKADHIQAPPKNPFTDYEMKTLIKLMFLGGRKLHFNQAKEKIDASFGGVRIASQLPCDDSRCF